MFWGLTDEIADKECVVVGPESVVNSRVPSAISAYNVVCGGDGSNAEEEEQGDSCC